MKKMPVNVNLVSILLFTLTITSYSQCKILFHDTEPPTGMDTWLYDKLHR